MEFLAYERSSGASLIWAAKAVNSFRVVVAVFRWPALLNITLYIVNQFPLHDLKIWIVTDVAFLGWWRSKLGPSHQSIHGPICSSAGQTAGIIHHSHSGTPVLFVRFCRSYARMLGGFASGEDGNKRSRYSRGRRGHGRLWHIFGFWHLQYVVVFLTIRWKFTDGLNKTKIHANIIHRMGDSAIDLRRSELL